VLRADAIVQNELTIPRRRIICRAQDLIDSVLFVCEGWAASLVTLPNGDRQILSFLLPGDIVSSALLFRPNPSCLVETITEVTCRSFDRTQFMRKAAAELDALSVLWIGEKEGADRLAIDLGRRTAEERIARLILSLMERLATRGLAQGTTMDFPLRQHHVADATGLTPVHVSKLLTDFRRRGLIRISDRSLEIVDDGALRRIAGLR
jgi:CRP-like cAMP-binding protein